jgi:hypothetical protein
MPHFGTLRVHNYSTAEGQDIRGANVYGLDDDKLGKIDDVIFDHTSGHITYIVIDTGGWLTTKKFLVPANQLGESAKHDGDYVVDLTKKQVEKFPAYSEGDLESEENWGLYEDRYRSAWSEGAVLHQKDSDRTVTPQPGEVIDRGVPVSESEQDQTADLEAAGPADDRVFPVAGNTVSPNPNSGAVGSRYLSFEEQLQRRRGELTSECDTCSKVPAKAERPERLRRTGT